MVRAAGSAALPDVGGAYLLVLEIPVPLTLNIPAGTPALLAPGRHLYAGSAHGPGGLRARITRHLRKGKRPHWHVDRLTGAGTVSGVLALPGADEHALVRRLLACPGTQVPIARFGSSDCRNCPAHLLTPDADLDPAEALAGLTPEIHWLEPAS